MKDLDLTSYIGEIIGRVKYKKKWAKRRNERYGIWGIVKIYLLCVAWGWSVSVFYKKLKNEGKLVRQRGKLSTRLPSQAQFYRRVKEPQFIKALLECLSLSAVRLLERIESEGVRVIIMDLTRLEVDRQYDRNAAWGHDSKGSFYGYKLGLIISGSGIILGCVLVKANKVEGNVSLKLLKLAKGVIQTAFGAVVVDYVIADSGFDSEKNYRAAEKDLRGIMICKANKRSKKEQVKSAYHRRYAERKKYPYRTKALKFSQSQTGKRLCFKRVTIEQVNGQIKDEPFRIEDLPYYVRGYRKVFVWSIGKLIYYNLMAYKNVMMGRNIRKIKEIAA